MIAAATGYKFPLQTIGNPSKKLEIFRKTGYLEIMKIFANINLNHTLSLLPISQRSSYD
jgi:hypothetical protein